MADTSTLGLLFVALVQVLLVYPLSLNGLPKIRNDVGSLKDYLVQRQKLIANDTKHRTGQQIVLSKLEQKANDILMSWKKKELSLAYKSESLLPAESFITAKSKIENSNVFKIIRKMPKGAVLHLHDLSMASYKWLIKNMTTLNFCYMCYNTEKKIVEFKFSSTQPEPMKNCQWISVPLARQNSGNPARFDADLFSNLTLTDGDPGVLYPTQNALWNKFKNIFVSLSGLLGFDVAFSSYYTQGLKELVDDNVQYAEIRALLIPLYDINGKTNSDPENTLKIYKSLTAEFQALHAEEFFGAKVIYIAVRSLSKSVINTAVEKAVYLRKKYPTFFSGFDLVGQEDPGNSLLYYANQLLAPRNSGEDLPYFFHAGETDWEGEPVDYNLADAILLGTKRVGHGFAFIKHPELMKQARRQGIAAEVCPISNQVLGLVTDLQNHPASVFLSQDFPMTVNSDDPAIWGATGLSYDFYQVFMAMTLAGDDLRFLKQLAINSIRYCSLEPTRKAELFALWTSKWDKFIQNVISEFPLASHDF